MTTSSPDRAGDLKAARRDVAQPKRRWRRARPIARDHALGLIRFIGVVQLLGGATLVSGYAADAPSVDLPGAASALILLGLLQLAVGVTGLVQPRPLQRVLKRWPGRYVAVTLGASTAVAALGGSNVDTYWVTSAQCFVVAAGVALPGLRLIPAALLVSVGMAVVWIAFDGSTGGYDEDGRYLVAVLAGTKVIVVGLWAGQAVGAAIALLGRWHVIELQERGAISRLLTQLRRVDAKAEALGAALQRVSAPSTELAALRVRLGRGVDLPAAGTSVVVEELVDELVDEHAAWGSPLELRTEIAGDLRRFEVDAVVGAEIASVARRQIDNVARHASQAKVVTLSIERRDGQLRVVVADDGGGTVPTRTGGGTAWSARQLRRAGGSTRYFDAPEGVGLEVLLPLHDELVLSDIPTLSVTEGLSRFTRALFTPLRWSGYIGDTVLVASADIDARWLMMPIGAVLIEYALRRGVPGRAMSEGARALLAAFMSAVLLAAFALPPGSPDVIVPATTSVIVPAGLLLMRDYRRWAIAEAMRFAAFVPLLIAEGDVTLGIIYPAAFYGTTFGLTRFVRRAERLEGSALDAVGRAALASAAVRGLALHHDAIDVILRAAPSTPDVLDAGGELEDAIVDLASVSEPALDVREVVQGALRAAVLVPTVVASDQEVSRRPAPVGVLSSLERIALVEMASLAADERSSCAPPGWLGRRRLRALHASWRTVDDAPQLRLRAEPQLRAPDPAKVQELTRVGRALGVTVESGPNELVLTYGG